MENYNVIYNVGQINRNDGAIVYIHKKYSYSYELIIIDVCRAIQFSINLKNTCKILITVIYRPPCTNIEKLHH